MTMNANTFYQKYGQYIARVQQYSSIRELDRWPYINPGRLNACIYIPESDLSSHFMPYGIYYDGYLTGVFYREGRITYVPLSHGLQPTISFQFSGCFMAKLRFRGTWFAFHISTSESSIYDCKAVWNSFLDRHKREISSIVMFKPTDERSLYDEYIRLYPKGKATLAGLITEDNVCYTLVYDCVTAKVVTAVDLCTDYIRQCPPHLLCNEQDRSYYSRL